MASSNYHPDPAKLRALAQGWRDQATRLDSFRQKMVDQVTATDWQGFGKDSAVDAASHVSGQITLVVNAANEWAKQIEDAATDLEKKLKAQRLAEILGAVFVVGLIAAIALGPLVAALAEALAGIMAGVLSVELATNIGLFAAGFIIYGALTLALDFTVLGIVDHVSGLPFKPTWEDGVNIGAGALLGGLMIFKLPSLVDSIVANLGKVTPKTTPLMDAVGLTPGQKPPTIQVINNITGDVSTISFTPRVAPPPRFGIGSSTAAPKFDATFTRTTVGEGNVAPPALTAKAPPVGSGLDASVASRPDSTFVPRLTGPVNSKINVGPSITAATSRPELPTPTLTTAGAKPPTNPPSGIASSHLPEETGQGHAINPPRVPGIQPPHPSATEPINTSGSSVSISSASPIRAVGGPARPNLDVAIDGSGHVSPPAAKVSPPPAPRVEASLDTTLTGSPGQVPHPATPPRTPDLTADLTHGQPTPRITNQPETTNATRLPTDPAHSVAPPRASATAGGAAPPRIEPGTRPLGSDVPADTRTFGLRPLEHIPDGAPPRPIDAVSIRADAGSVPGGPHLTELPPPPKGAAETTFVSADGGRTWAQTPQPASVSTFDRVLHDISAANRADHGTPLDLTVARQLKWTDPNGAPKTRTEFYQHDALGWKPAPTGDAQSMFPHTQRTGPAGYEALTEKPPAQLTEGRPLTWDALRQHDTVSASSSDTAGGGRVLDWIRQTPQGVPDEPVPPAAASSGTGLGGFLRGLLGHGNTPPAADSAVAPDMYRGTAGGDRPDSLVMAPDQHGPRGPLPSQVDRYYVSLDGGDHWTLYNVAGEAAPSVERGLSTILQGVRGDAPSDGILVATVRRGLDVNAETRFHLGPEGWRASETGRPSSLDDLPPGPRTVEVWAPQTTARGNVAERWVEVRRWSDLPPARTGDGVPTPQPRQVTARDVEVDLGYAPGGPGGRPEGYIVQATELERTPTDIRLFRNDGRGWQQIRPDDLPHLDRTADPFGGGNGPRLVGGSRDATGLTATDLGRLTNQAELHESSAAFSQRRGLEWLEQARTADSPASEISQSSAGSAARSAADGTMPPRPSGDPVGNQPRPGATTADPRGPAGPTDPHVFMVEIPAAPTMSEVALLGGKGSPTDTFGTWVSDLAARHGGLSKDITPVSRPGKGPVDPELPTYDMAHADQPPRVVDGLDYGVFNTQAPKPLDLRSTLGGKNGYDALLTEIDRIIAERRAMAEGGTGGEARAEPPPARPAGDEPTLPPRQPSLRAQAIDAMAKHEEMVEYSQSGLTPAGRGVPSLSNSSAPGRGYTTIRDDLIAVGNKPTTVATPVTPGDGVGLDAATAGTAGGERPFPAAAQFAYTRNLTLGEVRTGLEGVVQERRDLLAAQAGGRPYDLASGTPQAAAAARLTVEETAALTTARLAHLDHVEAALYRAWESRLGVMAPPPRVPPSTQVDGRPAIESELARLVDLRRHELGGVRPSLPAPTSPARADEDLLTTIRNTEAELLTKALAIEAQSLKAELSTVTRALAGVRDDLASTVADLRTAQAGAGGTAAPPIGQIRLATEAFDRLTVEGFRLDRQYRALVDQLDRAGTARPPGWALSAGTTTAPGAPAVTFRDPPPAPAAPTPRVDQPHWDFLLGPRGAPSGDHALVSFPSGYVLRGTPATALPDSDRSVAQLAPGINGALRIMPDVPALSYLDTFVNSITPWLRYRVVVDLRLIPSGTPLPLDPKLFAARNFVNVDVPPESVTHPDPARGFPVGPNGDRTVEVLASSYRWAPSGLHVPPPPTSFLPRPPMVSQPFHPGPLTRGGAIPGWLDGSATTEPAAYDVGNGWVATIVGGARWLHPADVPDPPAAIGPASGNKIFIGVGGRPTPDAIWQMLHNLVDRLMPDAAGRLAFVALGGVAPATVSTPVPSPPGGQPLAPNVLLPPHLVHAKIDDFVHAVLANPTQDTVANQAATLAALAWGTRTDDMPVPTSRIGPTSADHRLAEFRYGTWEVVATLPPDGGLARWTPADARRFAGVIGHEIVHGQQFTQIARYLAALHPTLTDLYAALPTQRTEVLEAALRHPYVPGTAAFAEGKALYESILGPGDQHSARLDAQLSQVRAETLQTDTVRELITKVSPDSTADIAHLSLAGLQLRETHAGLMAEYKLLPHETPAFLWEDSLNALSGQAPAGAIAESRPFTFDLESLEPALAGPMPGRAAALPQVPDSHAHMLPSVAGRATDAPVPLVADPATVTRGWLAQDGWAASAEFFVANRATLSSGAATASLLSMLAANPGSTSLTVHAALLDLAAHGRLDDAYAYLGGADRVTRKQTMLAQVRPGTDPAAFDAFSYLPGGIGGLGGIGGPGRIGGIGGPGGIGGIGGGKVEQVSFSERSYASMMQSIARLLTGDAAGAIELAAQARRYLTGHARVDWVMALDALARGRPGIENGIQSLQQTIVDCD